jgi:hypothetical protein
MIALFRGCEPAELDARELGAIRDLAHEVWTDRGVLERERRGELDPDKTPPMGIRAKRTRTKPR